MKKEFPDFFPNGFKNLIYSMGARDQSLDVYRICRQGVVNRDAFASTYESRPDLRKKEKRQDVVNRDAYRLEDIDVGLYSTSCFTKIKDIKRIFNAMAKTTPKQIVAKGVTDPQCGPCLDSSSTTSSHVHWWLYKDSHPEHFFKKTNVKEE